MGRSRADVVMVTETGLFENIHPLETRTGTYPGMERDVQIYR